MADIVYPDYSNNLYALSNSILQAFGIENNKQPLSIEINEKKKVCFVLIDGLGLDMLSRYENGTDVELRKITTVFPSTTATALSSIFLNRTPGEHGIVGYKTFYKQAAGIIKPLEFTYAALSRGGILNSIGNSRDFFPFTNIFTKLYQKRKIKSSIITSIDTMYSEFSDLIFSGAKSITGYHNIWDCLEIFDNELKNGRSRFVYLYVPYIDSLSHIYTKNDGSTKSAVHFIYNGIKSILKRNENKVFGLLSSDHGHSSVSDFIELGTDTNLMNKLDLPPYGDGRALMFRSRNNIKPELSKYNLKTFNKNESLKLFGETDDNVYSILPDFVSVPTDGVAYSYSYYMHKGVVEERPSHLKSHHGGLSKEEMEIPLVIFS